MKKITVFTSVGGGGHLSASNAIKTYLKNEYLVEDVIFIQTALNDLDLMRIVSRGKIKAEDIYNFFMRKKWFRMANMLYYFGRMLSKRAHKVIRPRVIKFLQETKTDIFVSVVPIFNNIFLQAAEELNIPFFLVPTDLDATTFVLHIKNPTYAKFHITQAFDDSEIKNIILKSKIKESQIHIAGFPIRPDFFEPKNIPELKRHYNVPENKPVIMLLMGAIGSQESYKYVKELLKITVPFHIIICLGKNEHLKAKIEQLERSDYISWSFIGFTDRISDLMAISDLFITKSGSVSVCEGIYMNIPLLLDHTSHSMLWEHFNLEFISKNKFGDVIENYKNIRPLTEKYLLNPELLSATKKRLSSYNKQNFGIRFKELINHAAQFECT